MANIPRTLELKNIPDELKSRRQWVLWRYEERDGKRTKVPYHPSGQRAESDNPMTWSSMSSILADLLKYDGIGIMCADGLAGVDLDHHVTGGQVDDFAQEIVNELNSYTEFTPSGAGLRTLVWGSLPPKGRKKTELGVEMYDSKRFFTVTGWHVDGTPRTVEERSSELAALHKRMFGEEKPAPPPRPATPNDLQDQVLLEMARSASNGAKFSRLWLGEWQSDYPSASEGDLALCSILAFWTGCDPARIDRLFRLSGLMRPKWDEKHSGGGETYAEMTIARAISGTTEVYEPGSGIMPPPLEEDGEPRTLATFADLQGIVGPIEWDWPGWLARRLMHVIASESGTGKSALMMRLAKTYVCGAPWPDGKPYTGEKGSVLWCEAESAQAINLERAKAWKIPLEKLLFPLGDPMEDFRLNNPAHRGALAEAAFRPEVKIIMIDSLSGADSRVEKSTEDSTSVFWLAALARDSGKTLLISHHLRKKSLFDGDKVDIDRLRGSSAIVQPARVIWALDVPDQQNKDQRRLQVIKSNIARYPEPVGMSITDLGVIFGAAPEPPKSETLIDKAADLLISLLDQEPIPQSVIEKEFKGAGISESTMYRAKTKLNIVSRKEGNVWKWGLPGQGR